MFNVPRLCGDEASCHLVRCLLCSGTSAPPAPPLEIRTAVNIEQFHLVLRRGGERAVRFQLPSGELIPAHFHVTEVGRVDKHFIDCGGTRRQTTSCLLQTWVASDVDHRLTAAKLAGILDLAEPVLGSSDLPVEVEHGADVASQYAVSDFELSDEAFTFVLTGKKTDCLAPDKCGVSGCC